MARKRLGTNSTSNNKSKFTTSQSFSSSSGSSGGGSPTSSSSSSSSSSLSVLCGDGEGPSSSVPSIFGIGTMADIHHRFHHVNATDGHRAVGGDDDDDGHSALPLGPSSDDSITGRRRGVHWPSAVRRCCSRNAVNAVVAAVATTTTRMWSCRLPTTHPSVPRRRVVWTAVLVFVFLAVPLVVERMVFAVRYITMGRPAILYGSPTDWKDVRGCLQPSYRQDVRDYNNGVRHSNNVGGATYLQDKTSHNNNNNNNHGTNIVEPDKETIYLHPLLPLNLEVVWTWYRYSNQTRGGDDDNNREKNDHDRTASDVSQKVPPPQPQRRLLVAQYSGFGSYSQILQSVAPVNRAYCKKWGHDYVTLEGTALRFPGMIRTNAVVDDTGESNGVGQSVSSSCKNNNFEAQSTFNKIPLLFRALDESDRYDQVLILDTDTMIVDFDYDITRLVLPQSVTKRGATVGTVTGNDDDGGTRKRSSPPRDDGQGYFLVAYRVWRGDWAHTWDVNAGISLWNLHHPATKQVAELWLHSSLSNPIDVLLKNDDQFFLQRSLIALGWWRRYWGGVRTVRDEFEYYEGTVIKHFKRDARSWSRTSLEQRLMRIQEAKADVCQKWSADCHKVLEDDDPTSAIP